MGMNNTVADSISSKMLRALALGAGNDGCIYIGWNATHKQVGGFGGQARVAVSTILGLARRGLVETCLSPDGGMMARMTDAGKALAAKAVR